jgi:opacity protein-like surface antigen
MKKTILTMLVSLSLIIAGSAVAAVSQNNSVTPASQSGAYINAGLGYGNITEKAPAGLTKSGLVWNAAIGYQINPYVAFEGSFNKLPLVKFKGVKGAVHYSTIDALVKGMYPVSNNVNIFIKSGIGYTHVDTTGNFRVHPNFKNSIVPVVGAGLDYYVSDHVAITAQSLYSFKEGTEENHFPSSLSTTLGLTYKF